MSTKLYRITRDPFFISACFLCCIFALAGFQKMYKYRHRIPKDSTATYIYETSATETAPLGMAWIPSASYARGCFQCDLPDALPIHRVSLSGFWMDKAPVTNAEFIRFVQDTKYLTTAERRPTSGDYLPVSAEFTTPGSQIFQPPTAAVPVGQAGNWWRHQPGASWKNPEGPGSNIKDRLDHPVVHVSYDDASNYCAWAGKRLPTEAEYEFAARGGLEAKRYAWGDELLPEGRWMANLWQGMFPVENLNEDGYAGTSPVTAFPPNAFGLYDISGNVWQWIADWYRSDYYQSIAANEDEMRDPKGPSSSYDPYEPEIPKRVQRGGSYLCSSEYCAKSLVASRGKAAPASSGSNIGFRCARDATAHRQQAAVAK